MPIYVYKAKAKGCERCRDGFEALQNMREEPLELCPHCKAEVERVPAGFHAGKGDVMSDSSLRKHGFKKLRRKDDGGYHREV